MFVPECDEKLVEACFAFREFLGEVLVQDFQTPAKVLLTSGIDTAENLPGFLAGGPAKEIAP